MNKKVKHNIIPKMPPAIIDAIQQNNLVLFVGAGISALLGLPLWERLSNNLVSLCREQGLISRSGKETLLHSNYTSVQKLSIAVYLLDENAKATGKDGKDWISENLKSPTDKKILKRADKIGYLLSKYKSAILTTNADTVLDNTKHIKGRTIYKSLEECPDGYLNPNSLTHIHGSILDKDTLVFTSEDYAVKYINTSSFGKLLQKALKSKTVLFIGYGVNEFELIRYFLDSSKNNQDYTLFKLDGYYKKDSYKIDLDKKYLQRLKIQLLDYSLEKKGYDALIDVLVNWDKKIDKELNPESKILDEVTDLLSNPLEKGKKERIEQLINHNKVDLRYFSVELCRSPYFVSWLEGLVDNKRLFDVDANFEYPVETEEGRYKSGVWQGMTILYNYVALKIDNERIDSLIIQVIKKSYSLIKDDNKEKELLKRRSASFGIMQSLVSIILSKAIFFNLYESFEIINIYLSIETSSRYMLIDDLLSDLAFVNNANQNYLFEIIKSLVLTINEDYLFAQMKTQALECLLSNNPKLYFFFGIDELFKNKNDIYNMGSFFEYTNEEIANPKERFCVYLINYSAKYLSLNTLRSVIKKNFVSKNETKNKMALSLIGVRLLECKDLFFEFQNSIFGTQHLYSDLVSLVNRNVDSLLKDIEFSKKLKELCESSSFGFENQDAIKILKTNLLNIISAVDSTIVFMPLSESEMSYLKNINKRIYSIPYDSRGEINTIYNNIKELSIDDAIETIQRELSSSSRFFEGRLFDALDCYLKDRAFTDYIPRLNKISYEYLIHYLYKINDHMYSAPEDDLSVILEIMEIIDDEHYENIIPAILYALEKAYNKDSGVNEDFEKALIKIKYKQIGLVENDSYDEPIYTVINTNLHGYLKLLINYFLATKQLGDYIDKVFSFFYESYNELIIFRAIIAQFYPFLLYLNYKKYYHLFLYIFDGKKSSLCYETLAYSRNVDNDILKQLSELEQFRNYLFDDSKDKVYAKRSYASYYIYHYILDDSFESLVIEIISDKRFISSVEDVVRWGTEELKNNKNSTDFNKLFHLCYKVYPSIVEKSQEIDQLIRHISEYIVLSNDMNDETWTLLVFLSSRMKSYFSDEYMELIDTFKNKRECYIVQLIDNFVEIYEKYTFSEEVVLKLFNTLSPIDFYKEHLLKWEIKLLKKDPFLNKSIHTSIKK